MQHQQPLRDVHPATGVDADQMVVEGGVVDFGERDAVGDDRLAPGARARRPVVGGVEEMVVREATMSRSGRCKFYQFPDLEWWTSVGWERRFGLAQQDLASRVEMTVQLALYPFSACQTVAPGSGALA